MSYPISSEVLELFKRQQRQVAEIKMYGTTETITLTESDIRQGGLTIDRYCISGSRIEIGSAVAAELALTLDNNDGRFDDTVFEGAELFVRIGIKKWEARRWEKATVQYIPMGYFTVDNPPRKLSSISLSALDRMVLFDKECKPEDIKFPINIDTLLVRICSICGVTLATNSTSLTNCEYIVDKFPESDNLTYRQILMWIAEITGTCAYIDWNGQLRLEWYGEESSATLSPDMRYSSDLNDKTITITGVRIVASDETVYLQGTDEYAFNIESNGLLQSNIAVVATALNEKLNGFTYTPYSCVAKPLVHLYPLDRVDFVDKKGNKVSSIVTNATFTMNANLSLAGQGETETANGYAKANPITKQEAAIINKIKNVIDTQITTRQQALIGLNETIVNSLGLYFTEELLEDGSTVYYYHDQPKKENSSIIYTFRAGGFAWTDKWEGDETVWQNGIDRNGNAVLNILSAFQITADHIQAGSITADRLAIDFTQNIVTQDELSETSQTLRQEFTAADGELTSKIGEARTYAENQAKSAEDNANAATDEKLTAYSTTTEMNSAIEQKANSITLSVSEQITETRAYADSVASDAEDNANAATDEKLTAYSTTTEMNSAIEVVNNRIGLLVTETTDGEGSEGTALENTNHTHRARYGSNRWSQSAIRQWLNSDGEKSAWWNPSNIYDRPVNYVSTKNGFLNGLDADFLAVIGEVTKRNALSTVADGGGYEDTTELMFLISRGEVYGGNENGINEGTPYSYYSENSDLSAAGTGADANRIKSKVGGAATYWWLRSCTSGNGSDVRLVSPTGNVTSNGACYTYGVAPACNII